MARIRFEDLMKSIESKINTNGWRAFVTTYPSAKKFATIYLRRMGTQLNSVKELQYSFYIDVVALGQISGAKRMPMRIVTLDATNYSKTLKGKIEKIHHINKKPNSFEELVELLNDLMKTHTFEDRTWDEASPEA